MNNKPNILLIIGFVVSMLGLPIGTFLLLNKYAAPSLMQLGLIQPMIGMSFLLASMLVAALIYIITMKLVDTPQPKNQAE